MWGICSLEYPGKKESNKKQKRPNNNKKESNLRDVGHLLS
jgi:hypothetical protein